MVMVAALYAIPVLGYFPNRGTTTARLDLLWVFHPCLELAEIFESHGACDELLGVSIELKRHAGRGRKVEPPAALLLSPIPIRGHRDSARDRKSTRLNSSH